MLPNTDPPPEARDNRDQISDRCHNCVIRKTGICSVMTADEMARLSRITHHRSFQPGQTILSYDEAPIFFAAVTKGVVKLTKPLVDGRQQIVSLLFPPDFLGRLLADKTPYSAEAAMHVELCCFRHGDFENMMLNNPRMMQHMLKHTLDKLDTAHDLMAMLGRKSAEERVASLLYLMATRSGRDAPAHSGARTTHDPGPYFDLHLKREEMADFLGLTYETVIRQIRALNKKQIICLNGRRSFSVPDLNALKQISG